MPLSCAMAKSRSTSPACSVSRPMPPRIPDPDDPASLHANAYHIAEHDGRARRVMQVYEQYVTHLQAGDADTVIDDYSADAILTTFEGVISGREALRHYFVEYFSAHGDI